MFNKIKITKKIKLFVCDFDGVFTDGCVYVPDEINCENINLYKKISFKDVMGLSILLKNNIKFAIISGEKSGAVEYLKKRFPSIDIHQKIKDKLSVLKKLALSYNITKDEILFMGDDINDIECLKYAGTKITVKNANYKVKDVNEVQIVESKAGRGAFREVVDCIIETI